MTELRCSYDPDSKTGGKTAGRKVKGTIHWVDAATALDAQVRLYDYLLKDDEGSVSGDFIASLNHDSLVTLEHCKIEPSAKWAAPGTKFQFLRQGYFCVDKDSTMDALVFNRITGLRDTWAKVSGRG